MDELIERLEAEGINGTVRGEMVKVAEFEVEFVDDGLYTVTQFGSILHLEEVSLERVIDFLHGPDF